jgi:nicotinate-nucleotide adenylyltransferase
MKIGILAGTFDPVHAGHLAFVEVAIKRLQIEKVLLMPERQPRGKLDVTPFTHRLAMLRLAAKGKKDCRVYDTEEKFFTLLKTMPIIENKFKAATYVIIVGSDVARTLADWPGIDKLPPSVSFLVGLRAGDSEMSVRDQLSQPAIKPRISYINSPDALIAASQIRTGQAKAGVPAVDRYIAERRLYS